MAKLYCKVNSDIRAGLGCRGSERMDACLYFAYDGGRSPDGGVKVIASRFGDGFKYKIMRVTHEGEELYGVVNFSQKKEVA